MNEVVTLLYKEHEIILTALNKLEHIKTYMLKQPVKFDSKIRSLISFFKEYADAYHHDKEEQVLFPEMVKQNEMLEGGVVFEMLNNHSDFRDYIKDAEAALNDYKVSEAVRILEKYAEELKDHIAVENDELFLMTDSLFNDNEIKNMHFKFIDCDNEKGEERKKQLVEAMMQL